MTDQADAAGRYGAARGLLAAYDDIFPSREPVPSRPAPTEADYARGWMFRYFLQPLRPDDAAPFEVDAATLESLGVPHQGVSQRDYRGVRIRWAVSGPVGTTVNSIGYPVRNGVAPTNAALVDLYNERMPGIASLLYDPLEYYRPAG